MATRHEKLNKNILFLLLLLLLLLLYLHKGQGTGSGPDTAVNNSLFWILLKDMIFRPFGPVWAQSIMVELP